MADVHTMSWIQPELPSDHDVETPLPGDALLRLSFVDVNVVKATPPRTSCRSTASATDSSDATAVTSSITSSSRDEEVEDQLAPAEDRAPTTWSKYVYFYPRHDMTYTRCLMTSSIQLECLDEPILGSEPPIKVFCVSAVSIFAWGFFDICV